ncbi:MAG TPA: hypothetical protein VN752_05535 [Solirubrobacterales bacterium]|nr:hypothetical protein [Solirubrobacterales bacterium]
MAFGPMKRGPQVDEPRDKQWKMRASQAEKDKIRELAQDGVSLPARKIPAGVDESELVRLALGLTDAEPPKGEPGKSAVEELRRRMGEGAD